MQIENLSTDETALGELGARVRRERLRRNLSQQQLADEAGVGRATVQRLEGGEDSRTQTLVRVLRALGALDALDALLPEPGPSPMAMLRAQQQQRRRATGTRRPGRPKDGAEWLGNP